MPAANRVEAKRPASGASASAACSAVWIRPHASSSERGGRSDHDREHHEHPGRHPGDHDEPHRPQLSAADPADSVGLAFLHLLASLAEEQVRRDRGPQDRHERLDVTRRAPVRWNQCPLDRRPSRRRSRTTRSRTRRSRVLASAGSARIARRRRTPPERRRSRPCLGRGRRMEAAGAVGTLPPRPQIRPDVERVRRHDQDDREPQSPAGGTGP
jgi:hypothetical protein